MREIVLRLRSDGGEQQDNHRDKRKNPPPPAGKGVEQCLDEMADHWRGSSARASW